MRELEPTWKHQVKPGSVVRLGALSSREDGGLSKGRAKRHTKQLQKRLTELQDLLYAEGRRALYSSCCRRWTRRARTARFGAALGPSIPRGAGRVPSRSRPTWNSGTIFCGAHIGRRRRGA